MLNLGHEPLQEVKVTATKARTTIKNDFFITGLKNMLQRYVINEELLHDFNVESIQSQTIGMSRNQVSAYLRSKFGASYPLVAEQVELHEKVKDKLPEWAMHHCLVTRRSLEQSSSQALAAYKATLLEGGLLVDLCGGLGVDDVAFSRRFIQVISTDPDEELNRLVRYNFNRLLTRNIIRLDMKGEDYLESMTGKADAFYLDADRRLGAGGRVFTLQDSSPDVPAMMPQLLRKGEKVLLKLSPMIDLKLLMQTWGTIREIIVAGTRNEVKEVLVLLTKETGEVCIRAVEAGPAGEVLHEFSSRHQPDGHHETGGEPCTWFYEPSNMLIKAGLSAAYASYCGIRLIHRNSHYMLSDREIKGFFGRSFRVIGTGEFAKSAVKRYLEANGIIKANVSARNFVAPVDELRKSLGIADGGDDYLFFTRDAGGKKLFFHCRKP